MTVGTTLDRQYFPGDGANKNFPFNFKFFDNSQIYVYLIDPAGVVVGKTLNVDYTLSGALSAGGGQVIMSVAPPLNYRLLVQRKLPLTQPTSIRNQGAFFPAIHEDVFDRLTMLVQQAIFDVGNSLQKNQPGTAWDFLGLRGINAADPVNQQDVATKNSVEAYVSSILQTGQGPVNNAVNVLYAPSTGGATTNVAAALDNLNNQVLSDFKKFRPSGDPSGPTLATRYATLAAAQAFYPHATSLTQTIDWAAIQGYLNSGAGDIELPDGTFVINDDLVQNGGNVSITASPKCLLKFTLNKRMRITGTADAMPALASNVTAGARAVPLASVPATALKDGDVLCLYDRRDYSWSPHRAYYRAGEFITVSSVSGTTVNIYGSLKYSYASANIDVYKITGGSVDIDGLKMSADPASTGTALTVTFCKNVNTVGVCSTAGATYAIEIDRCMGGSISAGNIRGALTGADDYGVIISNSTNIKINSDIKAGRHCVALGGGAGICAIPYRGTRIYNSILRNLDGGAGAGDTHGNGDDTKYFYCTFDTHFNMAGKDTGAYFCKIYSRTGYPDGCAVYGSEIVGGEFNLIGCEYILNGDLASFGAIHLFPSQKLVYDWTVNVQDSRVSGAVTGSTAKFIRINVQLNETKKTTVIHEGTDYTAGNLFAFIYMRCEDDPTFAIVSDGVISDGIKRGPAGAYLIAPGITGMANVKTRQQRQSGSVVVTGGTTPTEIIAAPISFPFKYSKVPDVITGCGNIDGVSSNLVAGRIAAPSYYAVTDSTVRPCVTATTGTWATGAQVKLSWQAGIGEL